MSFTFDTVAFLQYKGPMHLCHEEFLALMAILPALAYKVKQIRAWFHARKVCPHPGYLDNSDLNDLLQKAGRGPEKNLNPESEK